jgi:predicted TIM-barrel fold metal-dependent hydrolase
MAEFPYISGDSHLETSPEHWRNRVAPQHRDRAPRLTRLADGSDALLIEGAPARRLNMGDFYGGKGRANRAWGAGATYDNTPGTGSPEQRLREQDADGIAAEVLFPGQQTGPRLWRSIPDDDAYLAVVQAWNSWLAEDYCSANPDRLIGLGVIPWSNVGDSITEMERCAKLGLKGVVLGTFPSGKGYPTPEDDKFWATAVDMKVPVTIHVELDRQGPRGNILFNYPKPAPPAEARGVVENLTATRVTVLGGVNAIQLMFAGVFDRFPTLRIFFAENQIGWIPYFLEQADEQYEWYRAAADRRGLPPLQRRPGEYVREHCYWGFQYDRFGVRARQDIGLHRLIWATDFPHQGSEWPDTHTRVIDRNFADVPANETYRMVCGNVCEFFRLDEEVYRSQDDEGLDPRVA